MKTIIYNVRLLDTNKDIKQGTIVIEHGIIQDIIEENGAYPEGVDGKGQIVVPALLDTHTHGIGGHDFNICSLNDMDEVSTLEEKEGVGGYLASLVVERHEDILNILDRLKACKSDGFLGIHLEGPYLNKKMKAVMKEAFLRDPNIQEFKTYCERGNIVSMTFAPELEGSEELINYANQQGIVMNIGHSDASAQQVLHAQSLGAKGITHLYNAMSQHVHREPGVVTGAILSNLMCELIVDGFHIHPDIIKATYQMIGRDHLILISDANPCKGLKDGEYPFSGKQIRIQDGKAVVIETGRIAGSTLTMIQACKNMMAYTGCSLQDVICMSSYNPAQVYGWKRGRLEKGYCGDILLINEQFDIQASFLHGTWL